MGRPAAAEIGRAYGMVTLLERIPDAGRAARYTARCACGAIFKAIGSEVARGRQPSCGCRKRALRRAQATTHGKSHGRTWRSWKAMRERCEPTYREHAYYADRGITVCERWAAFENFIADMGERPDGMTLDRYPNNDGNYEPGNCRWATPKQQARNRRAPRRKSC
jgi:hypothetical protein